MSDQDENIFVEKPAEPTQTPQSTETPISQEPSGNMELETILATIKTEDGRQKYADVQSALKSIAHAQEHIAKLEADNAKWKTEAEQYRAQAEEIKAAEELLSKLESGSKETPSTEEKPSLTPEEVAALVEKQLSAKEAETKAKSNLAEVVGKVSTLHGEKSEEVFYGRMAEVGLSRAEANLLASRSPSAALKIVGIDAKTAVPGKTHSSVNTDAFSQGQTQKPSAKIPDFPNTKDLVTAWRAAGEAIKE